jgi:hypothetical protein
MPAGAVEHENGMSAGRDGAGDLGEMVVDRAGIGEGHDEAAATPRSGQTAPKMQAHW